MTGFEWYAERIERLKHRDCWGGLDIASKTDIAASVFLFPEEQIGRVTVLPFFWSTQEQASRRSKEPQNAGKYAAWAKQGWITLCDGARIDQELIRHKMLWAHETFQLHDTAYDNWNAEALRIQLENDGLEMIEFAQSLRNYNEPTKELLARVREHKIDHGNHPILRWMASNLAIHTDSSGNMRPCKKSSGDKIDGMCALIMALARTMLSDHSESVYESRGVLTI